jgi:hypothetical protein
MSSTNVESKDNGTRATPDGCCPGGTIKLGALTKDDHEGARAGGTEEEEDDDDEEEEEEEVCAAEDVEDEDDDDDEDAGTDVADRSGRRSFCSSLICVQRK